MRIKRSVSRFFWNCILPGVSLAVISYFGAVNATVRADLRVEPGKLTEATLYHKAAQISFRLVSEAGGEAIADVDWTFIGDRYMHGFGFGVPTGVDLPGVKILSLPRRS